MIPVTGAAAGADPKENAEKQPERSYIPEERSGRGHGSKNTGKKIAALVMSGILFGCVAGGTMVGVNALSNRLLPGETAQETIGQVSQETQADAGTKTQASIGNDVSSIVEKAMPSVVAINNKMIYTQNNWLFGQQQYEVPSSGSGIIAGQNDTELLIITKSLKIPRNFRLPLLITRALRQRSKVLIPIRIWQSLPYSFRIYRKKRENRLRQPIWAILIP